MGKTEQIASLIVFNLFFLFFIGAIFLFIRQYRLKKKEHLDAIFRQNVEHQKDLLTTQVEIQSQTMKEIGREIHDNVGQKLTLASIYIQQFNNESKDFDIEKQTQKVLEVINQSLDDLRALSKSLTDDTVDSKSIVSLIKSECKKINSLEVCKVSFQTNAKELDLSYEIKVVLLRICQEFIQNSLKHSGCKNIRVSLNYIDKLLSFKLEDDGTGFDLSTTKINGIGLSNMKKRTEILKGTYDFESQLGFGTKLTIKIVL